MNRYLLDTNTCIDYLRGRHQGLVARVRSKRPRELRLCSVVVGELFYGAHRSADPVANLRLVAEFVDSFISFAFDDHCAEVSGKLRSTLEASGAAVGPYDLQIASIAVARGLIVVTSNVSEFSRVPGLKLEDWRT